MGGTFDPIHYGHLFAAEEARTTLALDMIIFIPTGNPPHKRYSGMASAKERYEMALIAIAEHPCFGISSIETERSGNSYTVDTMKELHNMFPGADFFLLVGMDAALDIMQWKQPFEISSLCTLVVISRPGFTRDKMGELPAQIRDSICHIDTARLDISATDIRMRAAKGHNIRFLLPGNVCQYIAKHDLYLASDGELS